MTESKRQCPEFPYFGAHYPDATCIDGYLWDLDRCDAYGRLYGGGDEPCPFCNTESFIDLYVGGDGNTRESLLEYVDKMKEKYL